MPCLAASECGFDMAASAVRKKEGISICKPEVFVEDINQTNSAEYIV